jgi:hypothetical protein
MEIKIGYQYKRSAKPYDVVRVLDILLKNGKTTVKLLQSFGHNDGPFYASAEDTKNWELY